VYLHFIIVAYVNDTQA